MKKKVALIVINNFVNDSRVLKEALSLKNAGYSTQVFALHEEPLDEEEDIQGVGVQRIKLKSRSWPKYKVIQLLKYFEFLFKAVCRVRRFDVIHCNDLDALPVGVLVKLLFNRSARLVYDAHEIEINDVPFQSPVSIRLKYWLEKILIKWADRVITVSDSIANEYRKLYGIAKPSLVLNTPAFCELTQQDLFRKELGIRKDQTIFLYQGGLSPGRGIEVLMDAFCSMEHDSDVVVFMGYGSLAPEIKNNAACCPCVYFREAVSPDRLLAYTASADYGIALIEDSCFSYRFCLPNKVFEYMMAGVPTIVSNLPEMSKIIEENQIGVVASENSVNALLKAIKQIRQFDRSKMVNNLMRLRKSYCWEMQEKVLLSVYQEII